MIIAEQSIRSRCRQSEGMAMIETILTRSDFVLTLSLDDESGAFECECTPPNQAERQEVRKITRSSVSHIGRGRAQRLTGRVRKGQSD